MRESNPMLDIIINIPSQVYIYMYIPYSLGGNSFTRVNVTKKFNSNPIILILTE